MEPSAPTQESQPIPETDLEDLTCDKHPDLPPLPMDESHRRIARAADMGHATHRHSDPARTCDIACGGTLKAAVLPVAVFYADLPGEDDQTETFETCKRGGRRVFMLGLKRETIAALTDGAPGRILEELEAAIKHHAGLPLGDGPGPLAMPGEDPAQDVAAPILLLNDLLGKYPGLVDGEQEVNGADLVQDLTNAIAGQRESLAAAGVLLTHEPGCTCPAPTCVPTDPQA